MKSAFNILEKDLQNNRISTVNFIWMPFQMEKCTLVGNMLLRMESNVCIINQEEYSAVHCLELMKRLARAKFKLTQ